MGRLLVVLGVFAVVLAVGFGVFFRMFVVEQPDWQEDITITGTRLRLKRNGSIMEMWGDDTTALAKALGYAHAKDRLVQIVFQRLISQGRLSETILANDQTIPVDTFFRELGFAKDAKRAIRDGALSKDIVSYLQAYADGVNHFMAQQKDLYLSLDALALPIELTLVGHVPEPWKPEDTLSTLKLMCYVGLAQTQGDIEKLTLQAIKAGVDLTKLKAMFAHLANIPSEIVELIKKTHIEQPILYKSFLNAAGISIPSIQSSNNWVVGPSLTKNKTPLQCNDPHLEINRLPAIWYEILFHYNNDPSKYWFGATVPGIPGVIMGRTSHLSYGFTYGFMDQLDFFIEEVKDGRYKRIRPEDGSVEWKEFRRRHETLKLKGSTSTVELVFLENENGILELANHTAGFVPADGHYLMRRWSWGDIADEDFMGLIPPPYFTSVKGAQTVLKNLALSTNMLLADVEGNIGYQQTGRLPRRGSRHAGGFFPGIGWQPEYQWNGTVDGDLLHTLYNPEQGWIATANDHWQSPDPAKPVAITLSMGPYRRTRADDLIGGYKERGVKVGPEEMKAMQLDLFSKEAEAYLRILKPLLPNSPAGDVLRNWDLRYNKESQGAVLFERFWERVLAEVYGNLTFGLESWQELRKETGLVLVYHYVFDRNILADEDHGPDAIQWFGSEGRTALFRRIANELFGAHAIPKAELIPTYSEYHSTVFKNILLDGQLPLFDSGPVALEGNRNTLVQGNIFKMMGRVSSFAPSWRYVTEVNSNAAHTSLPTGPSGRRFSSMYYNHEFYFAGQYHQTTLASTNAP